jgi:hypothetical protein
MYYASKSSSADDLTSLAGRSAKTERTLTPSARQLDNEAKASTPCSTKKTARIVTPTAKDEISPLLRIRIPADNMSASNSSAVSTYKIKPSITVKAEKIETAPLACGISALFLGIGIIFGTYNLFGKDDHVLRLLTKMSLTPSSLNNMIASSTIITLCSIGFIASAAVCLKHIYKSLTTKAPEPSAAISLGYTSARVGFGN